MKFILTLALSIFLLLTISLLNVNIVSAYTEYRDTFTNLISCDGNFTTSCISAYDGDYNTYTRFASGSIIVNYSITEYTQFTIMQIRFGNNLTNLTIPAICLNYTSLIIEISGAESGEFSAVDMRCQKTGGTELIYFVDTGGFKQNNYIYEFDLFSEIVVPKPEVTDTEVYQQMASAGAGLGIFTNNIAIPLMNFLLIEFLVIIIVVIVAIALAHALRHYVVQITS